SERDRQWQRPLQTIRGESPELSGGFQGQRRVCGLDARGRFFGGGPSRFFLGPGFFYQAPQPLEKFPLGSRLWFEVAQGSADPGLRLEAQTQAEAQLPGPADRIRSRLRSGDPSKVRAVGVAAGIREVWCIAQVERFRAKLQIHPLSQFECAKQA